MRLLGSVRTDRLPDFLVIGAMKAGTTSLFHYLRDHPQVFMPPEKELDFFAERGNWHRGVDWYRSRFRGAPEDAVAGEASTLYSKYPVVPDVPERIASVIPNCLILYVVRDPIERIRSHYEHRVALGSEREPLEAAVQRDPVYLACSRYASQIDRYLSCFPRSRMLLVDSRRLRNDRVRAMREAYEFLGVRQEVIPASLAREYYRTDERISYPKAAAGLRRALKRRFPRSKRAKELVDSSIPMVLRATRRQTRLESPRAVDPQTRERLASLLYEDVERLRTYMPPDFDGWGIA